MVEKQFGSARNKAEQFAAATKDVGKAAEAAGKGAEKGAVGLGKFGSSIMRIVKYRVIRAVIRNIMDAFKEGLQNVRDYSAGLDGEGKRIANAFNSLSSVSLKMKNQLGSAFAELLVTLMPVIQKIVEWITLAANAISQFFAALGGNSRYYKAVDASAQVASNLKSGAGSAKEIRNQLMGFDVINRLDAPSSGSGSGGSATNNGVKDMFEYVDLDAWTEKVAAVRERLVELWNSVKDSVMQAWNYIKEHFDLGGFFNDLCDIAQGAVMFISGILSGDWKMAFDGAALVVQGFGNIIVGVLDFVQDIGDSFFDWIYNGVDSVFNWLSEKTGYNFDLMKNAVLGVVESIKKLFDGLANAIRQALNGLVMFITGVFTWDLEKAQQGIVSMLKGVVNAFITGVEAVFNTVISAINLVLGLIQGVVPSFGRNGSFKFSPVSLPRFANGGFPEDGLFMANHDELVGQFSGGNTAVANNEQIIEGIKRGVYEAMSSAMSDGGKNTHTTEIDINGRAFFRAVWDDYKAVAREHGVALANT